MSILVSCLTLLHVVCVCREVMDVPKSLEEWFKAYLVMRVKKEETAPDGSADSKRLMKRDVLPEINLQPPEGRALDASSHNEDLEPLGHYPEAIETQMMVTDLTTESSKTTSSVLHSKLNYLWEYVLLKSQCPVF